MTNYEKFLALHQQDRPFLLGNSWDAASAKLLEAHGFKAIATSSAALANSLGYEDGEKIPFAELLYVAERIMSSIQAPLSIDLEKGFGPDIETILSNIDQLVALGVVGMNIEDSERAESKRALVPTDVFNEKLLAISRHKQTTDAPIFVNARTDAYLLNVPNPLEVTLERIMAYERAGANGIFVPFLTNIEDIRVITAATRLPINLLAAPGLPSIDILSSVGVKRISLGSGLYRATCRQTDRLVVEMQQLGTTDGLFK